MHTAYIPITRHWDMDDDLHRTPEIQVESGPDEDQYTDASMTSIQAFDREEGDAIGGQIVLSPDQLAKLHEAISQRLVELGHPSLAQ